MCNFANFSEAVSGGGNHRGNSCVRLATSPRMVSNNYHLLHNIWYIVYNCHLFSDQLVVQLYTKDSWWATSFIISFVEQSAHDLDMIMRMLSRKFSLGIHMCLKLLGWVALQIGRWFVLSFYIFGEYFLSTEYFRAGMVLSSPSTFLQ